jgi:uncharacterized protein YegP (UPF0339 family)
MKAQIYKDQAGEWRWRLRADNGEPIADSAEGYVDERDARHGLRLMLQATLADVTIETTRPS